MSHLTFAITASLEQFGDRSMRRPLLLGILITLAAMLAVGATLGVAAASYLAALSVPFIGPLEGIGGFIGIVLGIVSLAAMATVFAPAAIVAVGFFADPVIDAVEEKHYPFPGGGAHRPLSRDLALTARYLLIAIAINIPLIPFLFLFPPLPAFANGYLLAREYFELAALRRETPARMRSLRRSLRGDRLLAGALFALLLTIPIVNIAVPVFGLAVMTHLYHRVRSRVDSSDQPPPRRG